MKYLTEYEITKRAFGLRDILVSYFSYRDIQNQKFIQPKISRTLNYIGVHNFEAFFKTYLEISGVEIWSSKFKSSIDFVFELEKVELLNQMMTEMLSSDKSKANIKKILKNYEETIR